MKTRILYYSRTIVIYVFVFAFTFQDNYVFADDTSPLCFTALDGSATVRFDIKNVTHTIQYSTNGTSWNTYPSNTEVTIAPNQSVYFRAASDQLTATAFGNASKSNSSRFYCSYNGESLIECSGNLMSLYGPSCPNLQLLPYAFAYMFDGCKSILTAPALPATTLADYCYFKMFQNCISMTTFLYLPATTLATACYCGMFNGCSSLTTVPSLPATTLVYGCYNSMFNDCSSLIVNTHGTGKRWIIPATSTANSALSYMFSGTSGNMNSTPSVNRTYYVASDNHREIIACVNDSNMGSVSGAGVYTIGSVTSLIAIPNEYYRFVNWNNGSTSRAIAFIVTSDTTFTAFFSYEQFTIAASSIDDSMGSVDGGGVYDYLSSVQLTAIPKNHYHFVEWSDGDTSNPRTITVNGDSSFVALFEVDKHTVASTSELVTGIGEYDYGETVTLIAHSEKHIKFSRWGNGETDSVYRFILICDTIIDAVYNVDVLAVTATGDNGYVDGCGEYKYLDYATLIAVPNEHCRFLGWSDGTVINPYTFQVLDDVTLEAYFEKELELDVVPNDLSLFSVIGRTIYNPDGIALKVYSIDGKLVLTGSEDISLKSLSIGIYVIVDEYGNSQKIIVSE